MPQELFAGASWSFEVWQNAEIPPIGSIVYTIWSAQGEFLYVGIAGSETSCPQGRINSHASGVRSGDRFCMYVFDSLVTDHTIDPALRPIDRTRQLDHRTRDYIRAHLAFRWHAADSRDEAAALELAIRAGAWQGSRPIINPVN